MISLVVSLLAGGPLTMSDAKSAWSAAGFEVRSSDARTPVQLERHGTRFQVSGGTYDNGGYAPSFQALLSPKRHPAKRIVEQLSNTEGIRVIRHINHVVEVLDDFPHIGDKKSLLSETDRFLDVCNEVRKTEDASWVDPTASLDIIGEPPTDQEIVGGMSTFDSRILTKIWKWDAIGPAYNEPPNFSELKGGGDLGFMSGVWSVKGIEVEYGIGDLDPLPYVDISADIPVHKNVSLQQFEMRNEPMFAPSIEKRMDMGETLSTTFVPYYGAKYHCYAVGQSFSIANLTVGEFRRKVETFADYVRSLVVKNKNSTRAPS